MGKGRAVSEAFDEGDRASLVAVMSGVGGVHLEYPIEMSLP